MIYTRPKMCAMFRLLGVLGVVGATVMVLVVTVMYLEVQGFTKDDVQSLLLIATAIGLGSLLMLGFASMLNILHDIRREMVRANHAAGLAPLHRAAEAAVRGPAPGPVEAALDET
jgi:hypothetical protein